ncbi:hypothetical protein acsn021_07770 [Anaerocolumna cellulosilytica]|uniref:Flavodoxin-like fold domain-containing protein n=1 Tax=Anaerocolumna cellulosilytica TaxID=433286 RepID=A0A6S6R2F2_9FIRM|nr:flavodoxin family protein [Anaerocolumna cellulosilytica]MBB5197633.1 putative NADPH-quinone reductase [Anaerocolumna cellulosilytica]BCJ93208.1 hypothetical protein acsn021_07770 [Anaerocolumna cellulosilytica]
MHILLLNSSIKKKKSRSLTIAHSFIEGLKVNEEIKEQIEVEEVCLYEKNIKECLCCYYCWREDSEGNCIQKDDMSELLMKYISYDIVIWSFPLLFYGFPAVMKKFIERSLPLYTSHKYVEGNEYIQARRYTKLVDRRELFISTCGLPVRNNNYEPVDEMLRLMFHDKAERIYCTQGTLFEEKRFDKIVNRYLLAVKEAGRYYSLEDGILPKYKDRLSQPFLPEELYADAANHNKTWLNRQNVNSLN